jgi:hypothetical protein
VKARESWKAARKQLLRAIEGAAMLVRSLAGLWFAIRMNGPKMAFVAVACDQLGKSRRTIGVGRGCLAASSHRCRTPNPSPRLPCPLLLFSATQHQWFNSINYLYIISITGLRRLTIAQFNHGTHIVRSSCRRLKATQSRTVSVKRAHFHVNPAAAGRSSVMALIQYVLVALQEATRAVYISCK